MIEDPRKGTKTKRPETLVASLEDSCALASAKPYYKL